MAGACHWDGCQRKGSIAKDPSFHPKSQPSVSRRRHHTSGYLYRPAVFGPSALLHNRPDRMLLALNLQPKRVYRVWTHEIGGEDVLGSNQGPRNGSFLRRSRQ